MRFVRACVAVAVSASVLVGGAGHVLSAAADPVDAPPAVTDAFTAPDEATASQIATTYGHTVVVSSETDETSQVVANVDGSLSLSSSPVPVRAQGADGSWSPLDLSLQPDGSQVVPQTAAVPVKFSAGGSGPLAQVQAASGAWLSVSWPAGPLPVPTITGASATYAEVFPGVDLQVTATATGMSEVLIIKNAQAAADPQLKSVVFGLDDGSMTSAVNADGSVTTSAGSAPQLISNSPSWWDSSASDASVAGPGGSEAPLAAAHTSTPTSITVDAAAAANTPGVVFPVFVDPPVGWDGTRVNYTFTDSNQPNVSYWNGAGASDAWAHVGYISSAYSGDGITRTTRTYWTLNTDVLANRVIKDAAFNTEEMYSSSCNPSAVQLWTTSAPSPSLTWANQDQQISWLSNISVQTVAHGYSSACPEAAVGFDITSAVQGIANSGASTINLGMRAANESDWTSWKKFRNDPTLHVDYWPKPSQPYFRSVSGCYAACDTPAWTHDLDPWLTAEAGTTEPGGQVMYNFQVWGGWAATPSSMVTSGSTKNVASGDKVGWQPTSNLSDGGQYQYRAQACDGDATQVCGPWSDWFLFAIDHTAPNPPSVGAVNNDFQFFPGPQSPPPTTRYGQQGVPGSVTLSDTSSRMFQYIYAPEPSLSIASSTASPCNYTTGDIVSVCNLSSGVATVNITPQEYTSTLTVVGIDIAGNMSTGMTVTYYPNGTLAGQAQHAWLEQNSGSGLTVADTGTASTAASLTLSSGVAWPSFDPNVGPDGPYYGKNYDSYLTFPVTNNEQAATTSGVNDVPADIAHSLTASIWVRPAARTSGDTTYQTVFGQDGAANSSFYIQRTPDEHWRACMPQDQTDTTLMDCTDPSTSPVVDTQNWTLLIFVWDAPQKTFTLYFNNADTAGISKAHTAIAAAATGSVVVGRALLHHGTTNWYHGDLADPLLWPVVLEPRQIHSLATALPPSIGGSS